MRLLRRYSDGQRMNHWFIALMFVLAGLSGLAFFHPSFYFFVNLFGGGQWTRILHPFLGVLMVLGGLAVVLGVFMDLAAVCIAVLMVVFAVKMHTFWSETDPQTQNVERAQFMKNISIAGGALIIAALPVDWYTITDPVF